MPSTEEAIAHLVNMPLGEFLAHYASPYYDPQKRRERYLRERELKGPRDRSAMSDSQKEIWDVSRDNIAAERKEKLEAESTSYTRQLEELRAKATEAKERLAEKLRERLERVDADIPIPKNATPQRRAFLMEKRAKRTAQVKRIDREERVKLGKELKETIANARTKYEESKKKLVEFYESESTNEYNNIRSQVK